MKYKSMSEKKKEPPNPNHIKNSNKKPKKPITQVLKRKFSHLNASILRESYKKTSRV